jgi:hypothetical protein
MPLKTPIVTEMLAVGLLVSPASNLMAQQEKPAATDNAKVNKRDQSKGGPTADQAKNSASGRDIMQKIRKSLTEDSSLSTYAHNVKVIAQVAGAGNVTGELTIKTARSKAEK